MTDLLTILGLTLAACAAAGALGAGLLHLLRRRSLRTQLTTATVIPVVAVAAAVGLNVRFMFLSSHDSGVVVVALGIATALAVAGAWLVLRRIVRASREFEIGLDRLIADSGPVAAPPAPSTRAPELPAEFAAVVADLAEARATLAEARAAERAAEQARLELVSFMSHDLRTPLAGLRALAEGLEDGVITDVPGALAHLRSTVNRMSALVDDLFALSRLQGGPRPEQPTLVSLTELISDVASESAATAEARGVALRVEVPAADPLAVLGSPSDLTRAFANLVANALRHTRPGETVRLSGQRAEDGRVQVAVIDRCGGIPRAHLAKVFDVGWRGASARSPDEGGAGLGLAIARGVVESHDGRIRVQNVDGGCRFDVDLPASARGEDR